MENSTSATWFDANSSRQQSVTIWVGSTTLHITTAKGEVHNTPLDKIRISPRLANVPRELKLPNGVLLQVDDNAFIEKVFPAGGGGLVHHTEAYWRWLLLLLFVGAMMLAFLHGTAVPWAADKVAARIPADMVKNISQEVYNDMLDKGILAPSNLSYREQLGVQRLFASVFSTIPGQGYMQLHLHQLGEHGEDANAFALPDGTIVISDALINLLSDEEIIAVIAHEIGHVYHRHGLRLVAQTSVSAALAILITGNFTDLSLAPIVLLQLNYSREFEHEADCFAYDYLTGQEMGGEPLVTALKKLDRYGSHDHGEYGETAAESEGLHYLLEALSTHPSSAKRANLDQHCR